MLGEFAIFVEECQSHLAEIMCRLNYIIRYRVYLIQSTLFVKAILLLVHIILKARSQNLTIILVRVWNTIGSSMDEAIHDIHILSFCLYAGE